VYGQQFHSSYRVGDTWYCTHSQRVPVTDATGTHAGIMISYWTERDDLPGFGNITHTTYILPSPTESEAPGK
jgi:hypothetical protein